MAPHRNALTRSLPAPPFHLQRVQTLHIQIHAVAHLGLERRAANSLVIMLNQLKCYVKEKAKKTSDNVEGATKGRAMGSGGKLSRRVIALVNITRYALEQGFVVERGGPDGHDGWGKVWLSGLWEHLVKEGCRITRDETGHGTRTGTGPAGEGAGATATAPAAISTVESGSDTAAIGSTTGAGWTLRRERGIEAIWRVIWRGRFV